MFWFNVSNITFISRELLSYLRSQCCVNAMFMSVLRPFSRSRRYVENFPKFFQQAFPGECANCSMLSRSVYRYMFQSSTRALSSKIPESTHITADRPPYTPAKLAYKTWKPEGELAQLAAKTKCPVYLMHGLLGYKEEFDPVAQEMANHTAHEIIAVDARNHGESEHADRMDYIAIADDLVHFLQEHRTKEAIFVGHSMGAGGLLALTFRKPEVIKGMFLIDAAVIDVPRKQQLSAFLRGLRIKFDYAKSLQENRDMAEQILKHFEVEPFLISHRVLPNIIEKDGKTQWRVNIDVFIRDVRHLTQAPDEFASYSLDYKGPLHILVSNASGYIDMTGKATTKELFPQVVFDHVDNAGHWIHIDQPEIFLRSVIKFINDVDKESP